MYLVTAEQMQTMDRLTIEQFGIPGRVLMENAGRGAARFFTQTFPDLKNKKIAVIAGKGNNGGDGFVIARYLYQKNINVTVYLLSTKEKIKGDAASNLELLYKLGVPVIQIPDSEKFEKHKTIMSHNQIWIDAIFGTGLKSEVRGYFKEIIEFINTLEKPVFAVDIPSGLDSDSGKPCGVSIKAAVTTTFAFAKTGHILEPGAEYTGNLKIIDIGIPPFITRQVNPKQFLITKETARLGITPRNIQAHKGSTGHLLVIAGSVGKTGAAALTAKSALRCGAGIVTLAVSEKINPILETLLIEAMTVPIHGELDESSFNIISELMQGKKCAAIGPGIGTNSKTADLIYRIIESSQTPLVIDADGLNNIAENIGILKKAKSQIILTPHPGEMAKLLNCSVKEVLENRIKTAWDFAKQFNLHLILKGAKTITAHPDGSIYINPTGNSGMASGGMGDCLTGLTAGLITQGASPETAARTAVYIHGSAADRLSEVYGKFGYLASEIADEIPRQISGLIEN